MRTIDLTIDDGSVEDMLRQRAMGVQSMESEVRPILEQVRKNGNRALLELTRKYDCERIEEAGLVVREEEIERACRNSSRKLLKAVRVAARNIARFHARQLPRSWNLTTYGMTAGQRFAPLGRVGIYVPGGKAAYPSTVLMNAIPAAVAGVPEIVMTTPCGADGRVSDAVLVAASVAGVKEIYRIGGAQAIAALAYGTETIRRVDKITGPGNAYVAAAKRLVFGAVGIDSIAGPTEVIILADRTAHPKFVAADLIAQAEHDENATAICISTSVQLLRRIEAEVERQLETAPRRIVAEASLRQNGWLIYAKTTKLATEVVNRIAPEHCEILTSNPEKVAANITSAGALFLGPWSTEALGDYVAGPNHTLPTSGTARFASALSVTDFMRFTTVLNCSRKHFLELAPYVETLAEAEGLFGHAKSVQVRRLPHV